MHILDSTYYKHISLYMHSVKMAYGAWYMQDEHHKIKKYLWLCVHLVGINTVPPGDSWIWNFKMLKDYHSVFWNNLV